MQKTLIAMYVLVTSSALILLKLGAKNGAPAQFINHRIQFNLTPFVIVGITLYGASFILYTYLISKYDLGYIIPLTTAFVYILIFAASFVIFNEMFTAFKIAGIILIVAGLVMLNLKK